MAETATRLTLNRAQRSQFFAHLLIYLCSLTLKPLAPRHQESLEIIRDVTRRLYLFCLDESDETTFWLSQKEAQFIRYVLLMLKLFYEQWPNSPDTPLAIAHLSACLLILQEAE